MASSASPTSRSPVLEVRRLVPTAALPTRGSEGAAGYDVCAATATTIPKRGRVVVPTGLAFRIPLGTYGRLAPRSGLAVRQGVDVGAGVIDSDYRGELKVVLFNHSDEDVAIALGDRIAQLILTQILTPPVVFVDALDETARGVGGFGSTGK